MNNHPSMPRERSHVGSPRPERPWQLRVGFWLLLTIAAFYLLTEHQAHLALGLPYLPFLLLAACPLIHVFGHAGHGGHDRHGRHRQHRSSDAKASLPTDTGSGATESKADATQRQERDLP